MKKFLSFMRYLIFRPLLAMTIFFGNEKYIRFCNKHRIIKVLYIFILTGIFIFIIFIVPYLMSPKLPTA